MGLKNKKTSVKEQWLEKGYAHFATAGPKNLSINQIGKEIGASRSSFYHHFGDISLFVDELLARHWEVFLEFERQAKKNCKSLIPDLYEELAKYPVSLRFHVQLFRHRSTPSFNYLFLKTFESSANSFALKLFADTLEVKVPKREVYNLWLTLCEAWYSRLDPEDLSAERMLEHGREVLKAISFFMKSGLFRRFENKG